MTTIYQPGERVRLNFRRIRTGTYLAVDYTTTDDTSYHYILVDGVQGNGKLGYSVSDLDIDKL